MSTKTRRLTGHGNTLEIIAAIRTKQKRLQRAHYAKHPAAQKLLNKAIKQLEDAITAIDKAERFDIKATEVWVKLEYPIS